MPLHNKICCGYIPAKKASATITAIKPSTIPIATNVSCISTESIFFIIFNLMLTIKLRLKGKLEKNLTIRSVFRGKGIDTKLEKNLAYASFILYKNYN